MLTRYDVECQDVSEHQMPKVTRHFPEYLKWHEGDYYRWSVFRSRWVAQVRNGGPKLEYEAWPPLDAWIFFGLVVIDIGWGAILTIQIMTGWGCNRIGVDPIPLGSAKAKQPPG